MVDGCALIYLSSASTFCLLCRVRRSPMIIALTPVCVVAKLFRTETCVSSIYWYVLYHTGKAMIQQNGRVTAMYEERKKICCPYSSCTRVCVCRALCLLPSRAPCKPPTRWCPETSPLTQTPPVMPGTPTPSRGFCKKKKHS